MGFLVLVIFFFFWGGKLKGNYYQVSVLFSFFTRIGPS